MVIVDCALVLMFSFTFTYKSLLVLQARKCKLKYRCLAIIL